MNDDECQHIGKPAYIILFKLEIKGYKNKCK